MNSRRPEYRRRGSVVTGALPCAASLSSRSAAQEPFPGFDAYVTKALPDWKVPGLGPVGADTALFNRKPTPAPRAAGTP